MVVFLAVNIPPWFGFSYLYVVLGWAAFQGKLPGGGGSLFPITYASALVTIAVAAYQFRKRIGLSMPLSLIYGVGLATGAVGLFELIWQGLGYLVYPNLIQGGIWLPNYVLNGSWIFLSFGSIQYWRISRPFLTTGLVFVACWALWLALGFPQVFLSASVVAFAFNSVLKVLSFVLFLSLVVELRKNSK